MPIEVHVHFSAGAGVEGSGSGSGLAWQGREGLGALFTQIRRLVASRGDEGVLLLVAKASRFRPIFLHCYLPSQNLLGTITGTESLQKGVIVKPLCMNSRVRSSSHP